MSYWVLVPLLLLNMVSGVILDRQEHKLARNWLAYQRVNTCDMPVIYMFIDSSTVVKNYILWDLHALMGFETADTIEDGR